MRLLTFVALLLQWQLVSARQLVQYKPLSDNPALVKDWTTTLQKEHEHLLKNLPSENKSDYKKLYEDRYTMLKEYSTQNRIIADSFANNYLQQLVAAVFSKNPSLDPSKYRIRFTRDHWPNASSLGEGTIVFNIGLFTKLLNESQVAFVICHEIAHYHLSHSQNRIDQYVTTINSKEYQKELKRILKSEFQQGRQAESLVKGIVLNNRKHSREHESSADSMAIELMKNTVFRVEDALSSLALLDSVDEDKYNVSPALEKLFNFSQYPFQQAWVKEEQTLMAAAASSEAKENSKEKDSLKTHPDCLVRISQISSKVNSYSQPGKVSNPINGALFKELQRLFDYEIIEHCYRSDYVSRSFYHTLQMLQLYPEDAYLAANIGRCLNKFHQSQKAHILNRYIDLPSPYIDPKYNKVLEYLQRLRLADIAAHSYYFLQTRQANSNLSEEMLEALIISKEIFGKPEEKQQFITLYNKQYPNGKKFDNNPLIKQ